MNTRRNISLPIEDYDTIKQFSKNIGKPISEVFRIAALKYIKEIENEELSDYLRRNAKPATPEEEKEFELLLKEMKGNSDYTEGKAITLEEILSL